ARHREADNSEARRPQDHGAPEERWALHREAHDAPQLVDSQEAPLEEEAGALKEGGHALRRALSSCAFRGPFRACARGSPFCSASPAFRWSSVSSVLCPFLPFLARGEGSPTPLFARHISGELLATPYPLLAGLRYSKEMELQRPRRRRDELGHEPLCNRIRCGVLGQ